MIPNMEVEIAGVKWKNPVTVASGTFGSGMEYGEFVDLNKLGAITSKGVAIYPWEGNATPRVAETPSGMLNAIGLQNPGMEVFKNRDIPFMKKYDTVSIVNVVGKSAEEYIQAVEALSDTDVDMLEIKTSTASISFLSDDRSLMSNNVSLNSFAFAKASCLSTSAADFFNISRYVSISLSSAL